MMNRELWQRYIDKTCTDDERKAVFKWLKEQDDQLLDKYLSEGWSEQPSPMPAGAAAQLYAGVMKTVQGKQQHTYRLWWTAAASLLLLAGGALLWWQQRRGGISDKPALSWQTIDNPATKVRRFSLPDGSHIWLTPHSSLRIPDNYGEKTRSVELSGEAYFEVVQQVTAPFIVDAGSLRTTVLGTSFNIEAYKGETTASIALTSGRVAVRLPLAHKDSIVHLEPGVKLTYTPVSKHFSTVPFQADEQEAWKRGAIVLDDVPLAAVFKRLEDRFHKKIIFDPSLYTDARFTGTYEHAGLDVILKNISFIHGFRYKIHGDTVLIH
ncbi:MAG TPA: FecR domain-containing protein [Chitinophaga sp.]|uniref:FecR family protein n=1 Tax=Chitinophaga sp. TaxID=1869181 RepID=UPI002C867C94|nr:FecR domain-containing protein [Chitinophaga sp.]HVI45008.1 FecR domain-containing protein [Chitinophaga sp.]